MWPLTGNPQSMQAHVAVSRMAGDIIHGLVKSSNPIAPAQAGREAVLMRLNFEQAFWEICVLQDRVESEAEAGCSRWPSQKDAHSKWIS